ncbi:hypothetical protein BBF96_02190 [Anoxybacter fermentans]|uniref:Uncharacterized protein n=2 Tax=Anoxybacter fermentans TaxID=1323375 RepID=A0A3S9SVK0_9FIRM|nr:hypothetical protein BBF96_02190 [Anoxybacter fermentans]
MDEIKKYFQKAKEEFKQGHYHLVVGNLTYALQILEQIGEVEDDLLGKIYFLLCISYNKLNDLTKAYKICEKGLNYYKNRDIYWYAKFNNFKGVLLSREKKDQKAIPIYEKTLELLKNENSKQALKRKVSALFNMGNCYVRLSNFSKAKKSYLKAFKLVNLIENNTLKGKILMGIGYIFHRENKLDLAERCYRKAKKFLSDKDDLVNYIRILHNLGEIYLSQGLLKEARRYYKESLKDDKIYTLDRTVATSSLQGLAATYLKSDISKVKTYCIKALDLALEDVTTKFPPRMEKDIGRIFMLLSHWLYYKKKMEECKIYLSQAKIIFEKYNMKFDLKKLKEFEREVNLE